MNNVYFVLSYVIKNIKLVNCSNFISASYEEIGNQLFVYLDYKMTSFSFYEWIKTINKNESCYYNTFIKDNGLIRSSYLIPRNKFVYIKLMLNNCIPNVSLNECNESIKWLIDKKPRTVCEDSPGFIFYSFISSFIT